MYMLFTYLLVNSISLILISVRDLSPYTHLVRKVSHRELENEVRSGLILCFRGLKYFPVIRV